MDIEDLKIKARKFLLDRGYEVESNLTISQVSGLMALFVKDGHFKALSENKRSCFNCKNSAICFVYRDILNSTKDIAINIDSTGIGKWSEVFDAMGNCCLEYNRES